VRYYALLSINIKRWLFYIAYCIVIGLFSLELASRAFWCRKGYSFFEPASHFLYELYPQLEKLNKGDWKKMDEKGQRIYDIVVLSGSAFIREWGYIEDAVPPALVKYTQALIRIHILAAAAHTSRDSYIKYKYLKDFPADLVIFYHGLNELRANNVPAEMFSEDYSHYSWYDLVNSLDRWSYVEWTRIPHTYFYVRSRFYQKLGNKWGVRKYLPPLSPPREWLDYGGDIKTKEAFARNIEQILDLAAARKQRVLLTTYAYYIPEGYSLEKFKKHQAGYNRHRVALELWGRPDNVKKGMEIHNQVIRDIALRRSIPLSDQNAAVRKVAENFDDICHLSEGGAAEFADALAKKIVEVLTLPPNLLRH
jgi:hypothetical protein